MPMIISRNRKLQNVNGKYSKQSSQTVIYVDKSKSTKQKKMLKRYDYIEEMKINLIVDRRTDIVLFNSKKKIFKQNLNRISSQSESFCSSI